MICLPRSKFRSIKSEIRVLGIDDGKFIPHSKGSVIIIGVVYRGVSIFEGLMHTNITIDGLDATKKIANMIKNSPYFQEIRVILLDGISFGGFNIVDLKELFENLDVPIISIVRDKPDLNKIKKALRNLPDFNKRWQIIRNAGTLYEVRIENGKNPVYVQTVGILIENVRKILKMTSTISNVPEPLRVAHVIASQFSGFKEKI